MSGKTVLKSTVTKLPRFKNADRAPSEVGYLLNQLPADFCHSKPSSITSLLITEAAAQHAGNAHYTIMSGLDAFGKLVVSASLNGDHGPNGQQVAEIGALISHLAVEAQFMQDLESSLAHKLHEQGWEKP